MKKNEILMKKYRQYLLPSILTSLALALNEFVDCMLVSNLLGSDALAIANLGCPVILMIASCYVLLGNGGSILYAIYLGKWEHDTAGKIFHLSLILSGMGGILFLMLGTMFSGPITTFLCRDILLLPAFRSYYNVLLYTAPVLMLTLTFVSFLPSTGAPVIATIVNIVANGINLLMDVVYIRYLDMGIEGAGYATITGYVIGFLVMLVMMRIKKVKPVSQKVTWKDCGFLVKIMSQGTAAAILQVCFAVKYAFSNGLAMSYGGRNGVVAFSLCLQTFSIASVFLLGVADTAQPLLAMLHGQKDYKGESVVLKRSFSLQLIFALALVFVFEAFPQGIASMYGVDKPEILRIGCRGIRIFALTYLARGIGIQFMRFFQVEQRKLYAFCISLLDGLLVLPVGLFLCREFGMYGVFLSYPISALIMLAVILIVNYQIYRKHESQYIGLSLIRKDTESIGNMNFTITDRSEAITDASENIIDFCTQEGVTRRQAFKVGLLLEEMAVYTKQHREENGDIDINLRISEQEITVNFRSIGKPFDPTTGREGDIPENIMLLKKMAFKISYDYIMGMNNTQIMIERT